jgi:hypothetical protein
VDGMSVSEWLDPREWATAMCGSDAKSRHGDVDERVPMVEQRDDNDRRVRVADLQKEVRALREQLSVAHEARELAEAKARQHMSLRKAVAALVPKVAARMEVDASLSTDEVLELVQAHLKATKSSVSAAVPADTLGPLAGAGSAAGGDWGAEGSRETAGGIDRSDAARVAQETIGRLEGVCAAQQSELASVKAAAAQAHSRSASLQSMLDSATLRATRAEAAASEATQRAGIAAAHTESRLAAQTAELEGLFAAAMGAARRDLAATAAEQARLTQHQVSGLIRVAKLAQKGATVQTAVSAGGQ